MADMAIQLAAVERRLRRTQRFMVVCCIVLLVVVAAAAQKPADSLQVKNLSAETVSARNLTIRDEKGRPRVSILMSKDGGPVVSLLDEASKVRMLLSLHENQHPLIQLSNANEEPQLNLLYNKSLGSGLTMMGEGGRALFVLPSGAAPTIQLSDAQGTKLFAAP